MPSTKSEISIVVFVVLICLIIAVGGIWFSVHDYDDIINLVIQTLNRNDLKKLLTDTLFTQESYRTVYYFHWIIYPIDLLFLRLMLKYRSDLSAKLTFTVIACKDCFKTLLNFTNNSEKIKKIFLYLLVIVYLLVSLYKISSRDIGYDEAWNYNYFINTPAWFPFILFNTYPLYHFSSHFFDYLPFDHVINIRLPAVLAGLFFCWLLFFVLNKYFSKATFFLTFLLATTCYIFTTYSCIAKGVMFSLPLSLVMFYCIFKIANTEKNKRFYPLYVLAGILNIVAVPTSGILCIAVILYSFIYYARSKNKKKALHFIVANVAVILIASVFYITTIINPTSANVLFKTSTNSNMYAVTHAINQTVTFFKKTGCFFFGNDFSTAFLLLIAVLLLLLLKNKLYRDMLQFCIICILLSLIIDIYSKDALPDRAFTFLLIPYLMISGIGLEYFFSQKMTIFIKYGIVILFTAFSIFTGFSNTHSFVNPPVSEHESKKISALLMQNHVTTCYVQSKTFFIYYPMVLYYYTINRKEWKMKTWEQNSTRYKFFSIADDYDCIITDSNIKNDSLPGYRKLYNGIDFSVYIKEGLLD